MESKELDFRSLICGKLLVRGQIINRENDRIYFQFRHRSANYDWALHSYRLLKPHIPTLSHSYRKVSDPRSKKGVTKYFVGETTSDVDINDILKIWYSNKKKALPLVFIEKYLDACALAWWYQDSGHLKKKKNGTLEKIILSTEQWTDEELEILKYVLTLKHSLLFSIDGQRRLILYDQFQINYFLYLVQPYMHSSLVHKIKTVSVLKPIAQRTTICLVCFAR